MIQSSLNIPSINFPVIRGLMFLLSYLYLAFHSLFFAVPEQLMIVYLIYPIIIFFFAVYGRLSLQRLLVVCWLGLAVSTVYFLLREFDYRATVITDIVGLRYNELGLFWKSRHFLAFFVAVLFSDLFIKGKKMLVLFLMILYLMMAIFSGSLSLLFSGILIPFIYILVYFAFERGYLFFKLIVLFAFPFLSFLQIFIFLYLGIDSSNLDELGSLSLDSSRSFQGEILLKEFLKDPLFGKGLGYVSPDLNRSEQYPWAVELSFMRILRDFGLIGYGFLFLGGVAILGKFHTLDDKMVKNVRPAIVGSLALLIAILPNPNFENFDVFLILIVPALVKNYHAASR